MTSGVRKNGAWAGRKRAAGLLRPGPCAYCGIHTDPKLPVGHPQKATWDHLVPRKYDPHQGWDTSRMVQACALCNATRGARPITTLMTKVTNPSRDW